VRCPTKESGGHKNKSETDNPVRLTAWPFSENLAKNPLRGTHSAALLEALAAKDRAALGGAEGNGGVLATLGTGGFGFRAHLRGSSTTGADTFSALRLATFATFGFVLEAFVGKEHLFAGSKDKLRTTFGTLQDLIVEFHEPPP
jgi:hypothetical protein